MHPESAATADGPPPSLRRSELPFARAGAPTLFTREWRPADPRRVVVIVHGLAEHSGRYDETAAWLAARGSAVHAHDQRGHGRTPGRRGHVRHFDEFLDDLDAIVGRARAAFPGLPVHVLGHSMGGLVVASWAALRSPDVAGIALSGAALSLGDDVPRGQLRVAAVLARLWPTLSFSVPFRPEAISRDPEVVRAYVEDPLVFDRITVSLAHQMTQAVGDALERAPRVRVPALVMHGADDRMCPVAGSEAFHARIGATQARLRVYPSLYHEILNEPEREQVLRDLDAWLCERERSA